MAKKTRHETLMDFLTKTIGEELTQQQPSKCWHRVTYTKHPLTGVPRPNPTYWWISRPTGHLRSGDTLVTSYSATRSMVEGILLMARQVAEQKAAERRAKK